MELEVYDLEELVPRVDDLYRSCAERWRRVKGRVVEVLEGGMRVRHEDLSKAFRLAREGYRLLEPIGRDFAWLVGVLANVFYAKPKEWESKVEATSPFDPFSVSGMLMVEFRGWRAYPSVRFYTFPVLRDARSGEEGARLMFGTVTHEWTHVYTLCRIGAEDRERGTDKGIREFDHGDIDVAFKVEEIAMTVERLALEAASRDFPPDLLDSKLASEVVEHLRREFEALLKLIYG